jgi:hypothetical protein
MVKQVMFDAPETDTLTSGWLGISFVKERT